MKMVFGFDRIGYHSLGVAKSRLMKQDLFLQCKIHVSSNVGMFIVP